ncbi:ATP-binding protein [Elusimicrobiota bacterium]
MTKFQNIKLSLQYKILSLFALAIILPAIVTAILITTISKSAIKNSIYFRQQEIVNNLAEKIDFQLKFHYKTLAQYPDISIVGPAQKEKHIKNIVKKGDIFLEVMVLNSNAREQFSYSVGGKKRINSGKQYNKAWLKKRYISQVRFSDNNPYVYMNVPIQKGVVVAKLDFKQLWQFIEEKKIGKTGYAFIVDLKGNLIAHKEPERVFAQSNFSSLPVVSDFMNNRKPSKKRWQEYRDEKGKKVVALYHSIPRLGWAVVTQIPSSEVYEPITKMYNNIALWTFVWVTLFLILGFNFVRRIVNPLMILKSGAENISKGKLDIRLNINTGDEIEELAKNFETMAKNLKELEVLREDLIRMIIHDLKSPLSGITSSLDYLDTGLAGNISDEQKSIVVLAKKSTENMLVMIQNLLDIAKMEEGKLELKKEKVNITELIIDAKKQYDTQASRENKSMNLEAEETLPDIEVEKGLIERVVNNLITNAIKHTVSGGKISIGLRKIDNFVQVKISDNGIGIPDEYKSRIFEKFVQIEGKKTHLRTGAGLGLTFCKMVVEAHGGYIFVESEQNKGSSFIFNLPI